MGTILRVWSYKYHWLYDGISRLAALSVGPEGRFRRLARQGLTSDSQPKVLDLCCGSGQATQFLVPYPHSCDKTGYLARVALAGAAQRRPS